MQDYTSLLHQAKKIIRYTNLSMADHFDITQIGFSAEPVVIIKQNDEEKCIDMTQHFNAINTEFLTEPEVKKPKLSDDESFYIIYSPEKGQTHTKRS